MAQRLIDANALMEATKNFCDEYKVHWTDNKVLVWIDHAPTVDAVEVVRCGECGHKRPLNKEEMKLYGPDVWFCTRQRPYNDTLVDENHFCSYGERRDSDG